MSLGERIKNSMFVVWGYVLFYIVGRVLWVPMKDSTVIGWLTTQSPNDINDYLYGWLSDNHFIWYGMLLSVILCLLGRFKIAWIAYVGFILGYILGYLFGPYPEGIPYGHGHYGWAIWGVTYLASIVVGYLMEKFMVDKN